MSEIALHQAALLRADRNVPAVQTRYACCTARAPQFNVARLGCKKLTRFFPVQALLGIDEASDEGQDDLESSVRREQACRALQAEAIELTDRLEVVHDASVRNLEALLCQLQGLICTYITMSDRVMDE